MDFYGYMGSPDAFSPDAERDFSFAVRAEHDGAESVEGPVLKAAERDMGSRVAVVGRDDFCGTGDAEGQVVVCRRDEVSVLVEDAPLRVSCTLPSRLRWKCICGVRPIFPECTRCLRGGGRPAAG